ALLPQSMAVYLAAFAVSTLIWGPFSDRYGRLITIRLSLAGYLLASIGCALAGDAEALLFWRLLQGLSSSGGFAAGRAMIRDSYDADGARKAMSQVMLLFALAPALAPILGGWLELHLGWRAIFWFLALFALALLIVMLWVKETLDAEQRQSFHPLRVLRVYGETLRHGHFLALVLSLASFFAGLFLYIAGAPTLIYDILGLQGSDFGVQFVPMVAGMMLGSYLSARLVYRLSAPRVVSLGLGLMLGSSLLNLLLANSLPPTPVSVIGPMVLYTLGVATTLPALSILAVDCFPRHRGTATSAQSFVQMLTNALVAGLAVPLLQGALHHLVLGQLLFISLAILFWRLAVRTQG
ncbi:MAG: MFS transporter, partial [Gammaproteobacteria bacterium]|nr:MFS transporter [Gammaproteobacteria bacterium]